MVFSAWGEPSFLIIRPHPRERVLSFIHMESIVPNIGWKNPLYNSVIGGIENGHPLFDY
jgi:hypothetical protein